MKAMLIAMVASLCFISFYVQATENSARSNYAPSVLPEKKIYLNRADAKTLTHSIPGIGEKRAEAIVNFRTQHGPFKSLQELAFVHGLGAKFVNNRMQQLQAVFIIE
jgi:competence protein ComEA